MASCSLGRCTSVCTAGIDCAESFCPVKVLWYFGERKLLVVLIFSTFFVLPGCLSQRDQKDKDSCATGIAQKAQCRTLMSSEEA